MQHPFPEQQGFQNSFRGLERRVRTSVSFQSLTDGVLHNFLNEPIPSYSRFAFTIVTQGGLYICCINEEPVSALVPMRGYENSH